MRLIRNATEEIKNNNNKYTEECRNIYENIRFCKVQMKFLYNAVVPIVFGFITLVLLIVNIYNIFGLTTGKPFDVAHIFAITIFALFLIITVGIITFYIIKYRKKCESRYFVKDDGGEFELFCKSTDNSETVVSSIVHSTRRKSFYVSDNKYKIDRASGLASEDNGFYDFLTTPNKVISKDICVAPKYRYKKKEVRGNITYYYFASFSRFLFGTRHPRSIKLVNGVVTSVCTEVVFRTPSTGRTNSFSLKYEYSHVNDDTFKIHIPKIVQEQAAKLKFVLPQESANIIYEKE